MAKRIAPYLLMFVFLSCYGTELRVAAQIGTEPKFVAGDAGGVAGLCIDVMQAFERVAPDLHFTGHQQWMPITRVLSEMSAGNQDLACAMLHTPERAARFRFLYPPLYMVNYVLLVRKDDRINVNSWDDLRAITPQAVVLVNRGFAAASVLERVGGVLVDSSSSETRLNLEKLVAGRGRFYFHRGPGLEQTLLQAGMADKVRILPAVMMRTGAYLMVSRNLDRTVTGRLQTSLKQLDKSGELRKILHKWE